MEEIKQTQKEARLCVLTKQLSASQDLHSSPAMRTYNPSENKSQSVKRQNIVWMCLYISDRENMPLAGEFIDISYCQPIGAGNLILYRR